MRRRDFIVRTGHAAIGACLLGGGEQLSRQGVLAQTLDGRLRSVIDDLESKIPEVMSRRPVPGVSMAVVHQGTLLWRRGFGVRDAVTREPVDAQTVFEVGSISKTVFAYAIMKLAETGVLGLDTPLVRYGPARVLPDDSRSDLITARHILSHTSGLPNWRSRQEPLAIRFAPGQQHLYSGEGYSYLQSVVTHLKGRVDSEVCDNFEAGLKVCGTDFDAYMRGNVLGPLGMASSGYAWSDQFERTAARPHDPQGQPSRREPSAPAIARYGAAGGLLTTPSDYARFLLEVLRPTGPDAHRLSPTSVAEMLRPQVRINDASSWALGWEVQHSARGDVVNHGGNNPGFIALAAISPSTGSGFVVMTNSRAGYPLISELMSLPSMRQFLPVRMPE